MQPDRDERPAGEKSSIDLDKLLSRSNRRRTPLQKIPDAPPGDERIEHCSSTMGASPRATCFSRNARSTVEPDEPGWCDESYSRNAGDRARQYDWYAPESDAATRTQGSPIT